MISALAYRPRPRPLQLASPGAAAVYLGAFLLLAFCFSNPVILAGGCLAAVLAGVLAGVGRAAAFGLRLGLAMGCLLVLVNALVAARGQTVLARLGEWPLLGRVDVTAESLAAGSSIGLRAVAVTVVAAVYSAAVDPDRVMRALRPIAGRSALTASLVSRMVPLAAADAARLAEAARLRGPGAAPAGRALLARRLVAGSLDRAVDVAATLELRGYGLPRPGGPGDGGDGGRSASGDPRSRSRHDLRFYLAGSALTAAVLVAVLTGAPRFEAYPEVVMPTGAAQLGLVGAAMLAATAPATAPGLLRRPRPGGRR